MASRGRERGPSGPVFHNLFRTAALGPATWLRILGVALLAWVVVELDERRRAVVL